MDGGSHIMDALDLTMSSAILYAVVLIALVTILAIPLGLYLVRVSRASGHS